MKALYFVEKNPIKVRIISSLASAGAVLLTVSSAASGEEKTPVKNKMNEIYDAVEVLYPVVVNSAKLSDPTHHKAVSESLQTISANAGGLTEHAGNEGQRFLFNSQILKAQADLALQQYEQKNFEEAGYQTRKMIDTCFDCHSRLPSASTSKKFAALSSKLLNSPVTELEKARLLVATRQFDAADQAFQKILIEQDYQWYDFSHTSPLLDFLILNLRIQSNYENTEKMLAKLAQKPNLPLYLVEYLRVWQESIRVIKSDKGLQEPTLAGAKRNFDYGNKSSEYQMDRAALIHYVQATGLLERAIVNGQLSAADQSEAYYLLGMAEILTGRRFWLSQAASFLEAAVRIAPDSKSAHNAYRMLEEHIIIYVFSAKPEFVNPDSYAQRLQELKKLMTKAS